MKVLLAVLFCFTAMAEEAGPVAVAQQLFDAMARHDADAARALFVPGAMLVSARPDGTASTVTFEKWVQQMGASKDAWLERMRKPEKLEHGSVAVVWGEYDFHLNGKFSHCGIDSFSLVKTSAGWKIAGIADTRETSGCSPDPL
jgi:hypothetical protein